MAPQYLLEALHRLHYESPHFIIQMLDWILSIGIIVGFFYYRSILIGLVFGAISWSFIAYFSAGMGTGSSTGYYQIVGAILCFVFGGVLGATSGLIGKIYFRVKNPKADVEQDDDNS